MVNKNVTTTESFPEEPKPKPESIISDDSIDRVTSGDLKNAVIRVEDKDGRLVQHQFSPSSAKTKFDKQGKSIAIGDLKDSLIQIDLPREGIRRINPQDLSLPQLAIKSYQGSKAGFIRARYVEAALKGEITFDEMIERGDKDFLDQMEEIGIVEEVALSEISVRRAVRASMNYLPSIIGGIKEAAFQAMSLGTTGAIVGFFAGGPVGAVAGFDAGVAVGIPFGIIKYSLENEGYSLFFDLVKSGADPKVAYPIAMGIGAAVGVSETLQLGRFTKGFRKIAIDAVTTPTVMKTIGKLLKFQAQNTAFETGQEFTQEILLVMGKYLDFLIEGNENVLPKKEDLMKQALQMLIDVPLGTALIGLPSTAGFTAQTLSQNRQFFAGEQKAKLDANRKQEKIDDTSRFDRKPDDDGGNLETDKLKAGLDATKIEAEAKKFDTVEEFIASQDPSITKLDYGNFAQVEGTNVTVTVTKSAKEGERNVFQVTTFDKNLNPLGDFQAKTFEEALVRAKDEAGVIDESVGLSKEEINKLVKEKKEITEDEETKSLAENIVSFARTFSKKGKATATDVATRIKKAFESITKDPALQLKIIKGRIAKLDIDIKQIDKDIDSLKAKQEASFTAVEKAIQTEIKVLEKEIAANKKAGNKTQSLETRLEKKQLALLSLKGEAQRSVSSAISKLQDKRDVLDEERADLLTAEDPTKVDVSGKKIEISAMEIERLEDKSLKNQERLLKTGLREGKALASENLSKAKKLIRALIKASDLPKKFKDGILGQAFFDNIKTPEELIKKLPDIEEKISRAFNKKLVGDLKDVLAKVKKAKDIAVDFVKEINSLVEEKLNGRKLSELTNAELGTLLNQINQKIGEGKLDLAIDQAQKENRKKERLEQIKNGSKPMVERDKVSNGIVGELNFAEKVKNTIISAMNVAKRKFIAATPMDVVFDMMDKVSTTYTGANFTIFKKTMNIAFNKYLKQSRDIKEKAVTLREKLGLTGIDFKIIGIFAALQQEGGNKKLLDSGLSQKEIDKFIEKGLTKNQQAMFDEMRIVLDELKALTIPFMKLVYNKDFKSVENYFPWMTDFKAMEAFEIQDMVGGEVPLIGAKKFENSLKSNVEQGFTIDRKGGTVKIKIDAWEIFNSHVDNATYLLNLGQEVVELSELANSEEYRKAVGDFGQEVVSQWIGLLARKGAQEGYRSTVLDTVRKNVGMMVLGFKLSTVMVQPTALLDGAALIGKYAFKGAHNVLINPAWRKFVHENFEVIRSRMIDDPAFKEFLENKAGTGVLSKIQVASFWALKTVDGITASAIAAGAYEKALADKGKTVDFLNPDQDAINDASLIVARTQGSAQFIDAPSSLSQGTFTGNVSMDKLLFQFQSFIMNRFSLIQHDMIRKGFRIGKNEEGLRILTFLLLAYIAEVGLRRGAQEIISAIAGDDDDELEAFSKVAIPNLAREIVTSVPVVGTLISGVVYGQFPVPAISIATKAFERANFATKSKFKTKKQKQIAIKNIASAILFATGVAAGIPSVVQIDQITSKILKNKQR